MKYVKAEMIFPEELLEEIQKHVNGELVYIPRIKGKRRKWGESSGSRKIISSRNKEIKKEFNSGMSIDRLCEKYCLSFDSIKKIIYSKSP